MSFMRENCVIVLAACTSNCHICENCINVLSPCTTNCHICTFSLEKEAVMSEREKEREMERGWEGTNVISLSTLQPCKCNANVF